ncbi:MAG TPA: sulfatase [Capillimicrobium sp.]|nr:sulfatase [Capillimicrobium sp.]
MRRVLPVAAALLAVLAVPAAAAAAPPERPNVVVIMTDDQTVEDMRAMPLTRRLIGGAGVTFARSFSSYPLCCPARATLLTGQYAHNHDVLGNRPPFGGYGAFRGTDDTLPVWLQRAGYATAHVGKYLNGYGRDVEPTVPPGWDEWHGSVDPTSYMMWGYTLNENGTLRTYGSFRDEDPALYQADVYRDRAIALIDRWAPRRRPFFLSVMFLAPHAEGEVGLVRSAPRHRGRMANAPVPRSPAFDEADVSDKPSWLQQGSPRLDAEAVAAIEARTRSRLESLLAVDEAVRDIVAALRRHGELDRTLIVFGSDNGHFAGEHRIPQSKYFPYEPSVRVPLMMRGPGVRRGRVARALTVNADLAPTILDVAGAAPGRRRLDGMSLMPLAANPRLRTDRPVLLETGESSRGDIDQDGNAIGGIGAGIDVPIYNGVRTDRYVYLEYDGGERELYDLRRDPHQLRSVHADPRYARTRAALDRVLARLSRCAGPSCRAGAGPIPPPAS